MNILDYILLIPLVVGAILGYRKGLLMEIIAILSIVVGVLAVLYYSDYAINYLKQWMKGDSWVISGAAVLVMFCLIIFIFYILGSLIKKVLNFTLLGTLDNFAGALIGIFKWGFMAGFILWTLNLAHVTIPENYTKGSLIYPSLSKSTEFIISNTSKLLPSTGNFLDQFRKNFGNYLPG